MAVLSTIGVAASLYSALEGPVRRKIEARKERKACEKIIKAAIAKAVKHLGKTYDIKEKPFLRFLKEHAYSIMDLHLCLDENSERAITTIENCLQYYSHRVSVATQSPEYSQLMSWPDLSDEQATQVAAIIHDHITKAINSLLISKESTLVIKTLRKDINTPILKAVSRIENLILDFDFLNDEFFETYSGENESYYKGRDPLWGDIGCNKDFARLIYPLVWERLLAGSADKKVRLLPLSGVGKTGKSTFAMRLAHDLAMCGRIVLWPKKDSPAPDNILQIAKHACEIPVFVFYDNALGSSKGFFEQFLARLRGVSMSISLIPIAREDAWHDNKDKLRESGFEILYQDKEKLELFSLNPPHEGKTRREEDNRMLGKLSENEKFSVVDPEEIIRKVDGQSAYVGRWSRIAEECEKVSEAAPKSERFKADFEAVYFWVAASYRCYRMVLAADTLLRLLDGNEAMIHNALAYNESNKLGCITIDQEDQFCGPHEQTADDDFQAFLKDRAGVGEEDVYDRIIGCAVEDTLVDIARIFVSLERSETGKEVARNLWNKYEREIFEKRFPKETVDVLVFEWEPFIEQSFGRDKYDLRESIYEMALQKDGEHLAAHNNYALLLGKLGNNEVAEKHYKEALRIDPDDAEAHNNYAILLKELGRHDEAEEHYQEALRINPDSAEAHYNYASLLEELGRHDEAEEHYKEALRINPDSAEAHSNYASLLHNRKQYDEAEEHYKEALRINPDYAEAHNNYAILLHNRKQYDEAEEYYKEALRINPDFAEAHNNYAVLLEELGRSDEAEGHYKEALRINPNYAEAHYNYAVLLEKLDRKDEAEEHFQKAKDLGLKVEREKLK